MKSALSHRNTLPPDDIATLATCLFDLSASKLVIYWDHPICEEEKRIEIPMEIHFEKQYFIFIGLLPSEIY